MLISDIRLQFYDKILNKRVLLLVSHDVDALCACKILQSLFHCDHIQYTIVAVTGKQDLERAYLEHSDQLEFVVLINCGANLDLLDLLQPEENVTFFVCDSHRPVHVHNVFNTNQIKLLVNSGDEFNFPAFEDVIHNEHSDDDDSGNESDEPSGKRRRFDEETLERKMEKRRKRREWHENKEKIMYEYEEFSYHGTAASLVMYDLAWKLSQDTNDLLWWAITALTNQLIAKKIDREKYVSDVTELNRHVSRHNHRGNEEENPLSVNSMKVSFVPELQLTLYKHWSLFESMKHSSYTACTLKLWTLKGQKKLHEFLADMGLPLTQSKQKFTAMDKDFKDNVKDWVETSAKKFGLENISVPSFQVQFGFKHKFCAFDVAFSVDSLLESVSNSKSAEERFMEALDCLSRKYISKLEDGVELCKQQMMGVVNQVQTLLDMKKVVSAGPFLYAFIPDGTPDSKFFSRPNCLMLLGRFLLEAYVKLYNRRRSRNLPLVVTAPFDTADGTSLVVGIPPLPELEQASRNFFGKAFEQAASKTGSRTLHDHFEPSVVVLKTEDRSKFFDALISLLQ
ncbi:putative cell division control protein 45-like [Apostichopus japonicus]|uniref:Putative cell division control protein 45-like n=1 Tax=Stichopus japonicus TaxID=307972 RepID=A0A2G8LIG8_STIJA|nr:putative cell division control protein 45-like [Apostichopus japonicus]